MTEIVLDDVTKIYPEGTEAVSDLDLTIRSGELLTLVGASGSGKSTVLRMIAGLEQPTSGTIRFDGEDITALPPAERNIAMVHQDGALYPHLSARGNLSFPLRVRRLPRKEVGRRVQQEALVLGIERLLAHRPSQLSAGHRQSVATGRALIREARLLLMDEPIARLDARARARTRAEIVRLHRSYRTTTVYVTNDQEEALSIGERVAVIHQGRLQQVGTPRQVYEHPATIPVASLVGATPMNTVLARLEGTPLRIASVDEVAIELSADVAGRLAAYADGLVVVGIRPEHVHLAEPGTPFENCIPARVTLVEDLGADKRVHVDIETGEAPPADWVVPAPATRAVHAGERVELMLDAAELQFFDPATGAAIP